VLLNAVIVMREHGPAALPTLDAHHALLVSSPLHAQASAPPALLELPIAKQDKPLALVALRTPTPMPMLLDWHLASLARMARSSLLLMLLDATHALQVPIKMATFVPIVLQENTLVMVLTHALPALLALIAAPSNPRPPLHAALARIPKTVPPHALIVRLASTLLMVTKMNVINAPLAKLEIVEMTRHLPMTVTHVIQDTTHPMWLLHTAPPVLMDMCQM